MLLFRARPFSDIERDQIQGLEIRVKIEDENYLLNVNEDQYLDHLVSEFEIDPLVFDFEAADASDEERLVPAEQFPPLAYVTPGRSYRKQVFTFHIPFSGAKGLLNATPSPALSAFPPVDVDTDQNEITFDVVQFTENTDQVNGHFDSFKRDMTQQLANLKANTDKFNNALRDRAKEIVNKRKSELKKQAELRGSLRVPIRRNPAPATYAVPVASPKRIVPRPTSTNSAQPIDPTIDPQIYKDILQLIHDVGKQMERLPATYRDEPEETLRDHFLLVLQPHFGMEGSATGETFNKSGKTDILIRYQNRNLFVSEYKFWRGQKQHFETINQLLSYLTWRESKTAIVYFVDGKEITAALKAIEQHTAEHSCFVATQGKKEESWFSYTFSLPGDREKQIQLSVLVFHLPK